MKRLSLILLILAFAAGSIFAQTAPNRTPKTKVSDALALLPAPNEAEYDRLMSDLASTGAEGVDMLVSMFDDVNNVPVNYALSGWAAYVSAPGRETARKTFAEGIARALSECKNSQLGTFYVTLLQRCGKDESVDVLAKSVGYEQLNIPALKALSSIGTQKAKDAIVGAMKNGIGNMGAVAHAIGDARIEGRDDVETNLILWTGGEDKNLDKEVYYALSRIGTLKSLPLLRSAAEAAGYTADPTNAADSYVLLLKRLAANGNTKEVLAEANRLLKKAGAADAQNSRLAAMEIITSLQGTASLPLVLKAMDDPNRAYRVKVLEFTKPFADEAVYAELVKKMSALGKSKNYAAQTDIITFLGDQKVEAALPAVLPLIESQDQERGMAAVWAVTHIGGNAVPALLAVKMAHSTNDAPAVAEALASFKGNINGEMARVAQDGKTTASRVEALGLLCRRGAKDKADVVLAAAKDGDAAVAAAACAALKGVVSQKDLPALYALLEQDDKAVADLQSAVVAAMGGMTADAKVAAIKTQMQKSGSKQALYYAVLAATGAPEALTIISRGFDEGSAADQSLALDALNAWNGDAALDKLYEIARSNSPLFDKAFSYFVSRVAASFKTPDQKRLLLADAMALAKTPQQKSSVLAQLQNTGTFLAMTLAGEYLGDADKSVRQAAAMTVINIGLGHKEYYGPVVEFLLNRASQANEGQDSSYQREEVRKHLAALPKEGGYVSMFNGMNLTGWKGLVENPIARAKMSPKELAQKQVAADEAMRRDWKVKDGLIVFEGTGYDNICTEKQYGDFEMYVDWLLYAEGTEADAGIYLRGTPQVQMWDTARRNVGAEVGSGGLYNNTVNPSKPTKVADNKLGTWNTFYIKMVGERVTVVLNGEKVVDNVILENYWDRKLPIPALEQIELQAHGTRVAYRNLYINELPRQKPAELDAQEAKEGFKLLFDGVSMNDWTGNTRDYVAENGMIALYPGNGGGGNLYTKDEYKDFVLRFEFQLTPAANNGIGIRTPMEGDAAYEGMEIQVLDNEDPVYSQLEEYQYHGSVYGVIPAKRGFLKPVGEWNTQEIYANGNRIRVTLNGEVILDGDIATASDNGKNTMDHKEHPGLLNEKGHIGFLGHGSEVRFRNIRLKELNKK